MSVKVFDADAFLRRFWQMDRALVALGFPAISEWWKHQITRFMHALASGARRWVIRAGRRAGKSTTLCRLAVAWAWFGSWSVPPGDTPVIPFVSISKDESNGRLRTIAALMKALGLAHDVKQDEIMLSERGVMFKVFAATTTAVVGFTSIAVFGDEVARWESRDTAANPASEVIGSLAPTLATQPNGFMALCSSPWSVDDFHAQLFDQGDNESQVTSFAPTWLANPTISEARTHELEPDVRTWAREYGAEPGATVTAAIEPEDVAACFGRTPPIGLVGSFAAIDASSLRGDAFTYITGRLSRDHEVIVQDVDGWEGAQLRHVSMADVVETISLRVKAVRASQLFGDQREEAALSALFIQHGVVLKTFAWSEPSKDIAMQLLRRLMRERRVFLPEHAELKRQLTSMKARLMPSGRIRYETNGLDYASCLITLAHAIVERALLLDFDGTFSGEVVTSQFTQHLDTRDGSSRSRNVIGDWLEDEFAKRYGGPGTKRRHKSRGVFG